MLIGYGFLQSKYGDKVLPLQRPARTSLVPSITRGESGELLVPKKMSIPESDVLGHLLFALKHEGTNLQVLAEVLPRIEPNALLAELERSPGSAYLRKACFLWEQFTGKALNLQFAVGGNYTDLFDETLYVTGATRKHPKWRVNYNGLGGLHYCPVVRKTPRVASGIQSDFIEQTNRYLASVDVAAVERALSWAYLSETKSSFDIEREAADETKAQRFVRILHEAHRREPLTEDYLVSLQNEAVIAARDRECVFREDQNWLQARGLRGPGAVTYVPPAPALCHDLMSHLMEFANQAPQSDLDPIVRASIASFGFVYLHPFMDGNGRLSRFLFHHSLCLSGRLDQGHLLPVSAAMKEHESQYLQVLKEFSAPSRDLWQVMGSVEDSFDFEFQGSSAVYRYWDATSCVEFGFEMAKQALDVHLKQQVQYLENFDAIYRVVNDTYDVRQPVLNALISSAMESRGVVSQNKRKRFRDEVPEEAFALIEAATKRQLRGTSAISKGKGPSS